jgi:hypothetical protein
MQHCGRWTLTLCDVAYASQAGRQVRDLSRFEIVTMQVDVDVCDGLQGQLRRAFRKEEGVGVQDKHL